MTLVDLLILVLATAQVIETWRHGSIFAGARANLEARVGGIFPELMLCMFCLGHWVAAAVTVCWYLPYARIVLTAFAVTRGAQLLNDLTHSRCRTPGRSD